VFKNIILLLPFVRICYIASKYLICMAALLSKISAAYFNNLADYIFAFALIIIAWDFLRVVATIENMLIISCVKKISK